MASATVNPGSSSAGGLKAAVSSSTSSATTGTALPGQTDQRVEYLEYLLEQSYCKIDELRLLLIKESEIMQADCTSELDQVVVRQRALHDSAVKQINANESLNSRRTDLSHTSDSHLKQIKQIGKHNSRRFSTNCDQRSQFQSAYLPVSRSAKEIHSIPKYETATDAQFPKSQSKNNLSQFKDDNRWYGSLDRNVVKKKKSSPLDKSRRHTKIVGSMAALEGNDELQPDEKYKIGLPALPNFNVSHKPQKQPPKRSPEAILVDLKWSPPPPSRPPKSANIRLKNNIPDLTGIPFQLPQSTAFDSQNVRHNPSRVQFADLEKSNWSETNLDDCINLPSYSSEFTLPNSFSNGALDVTDSFSRCRVASPTDISEKSSKSSENSEARAYANEFIKPFEMADYYKYSTKFRQSRHNPIQTGEINSDVANGNSIQVITDDALDSNCNPNQTGPRLPPKDSLNQMKSQNGFCNEMTDDDDESDLGWVMESRTKPTLV